MRKYLVYILFIAFFIFFQSTGFYSSLNIRGVSPDFLLIILSATAFLLGPMPGQIIGFTTGFIVDVLTGGLLGISAFTFTVIGYVVGTVGYKVYSRSILISMILIFVVSILKAIILSMFAAIFLEPGYFGYFSEGRIFLEAVMNCLLTPPLFFIIIKIEGKVAV